MDLHSLKPANGATKKTKRIGRGQGSGKGGTSTRGHKGAQSRSGYSRKLGFEGGQMPIYRLVPKRGFKNINRIEYSAINLSTLQYLTEKLNLSEINIDILISNGLAKKKDLIKVLGKGELKQKLNVSAHAFSATAKEAIEKLGGTVTILRTPKTETLEPEAKKVKPVKEKSASVVEDTKPEPAKEEVAPVVEDIKSEPEAPKAEEE